MYVVSIIDYLGQGVGGGGDVQPGQRLARQDSQLCKDEQDHRTVRQTPNQ